MKDEMERTIKVSNLKAVFETVLKDAAVHEKISDDYILEAWNSEDKREKDWSSILSYYHYGHARGLWSAVSAIADKLDIYID